MSVVAESGAPDGATTPGETVMPGRTSEIPIATLALLVGAVLAATNSAGVDALLAAVAVAQAVLVGAWVFATGLPGRIGALIYGVLAAGAADVAVMRWHHDGFGPILGVLAVAIPLMFIHQLTRGVVRVRVVESLALIAVLVLAEVSLAGLVLLRQQGGGDDSTLTVAAAACAGVAASYLTDAVAPLARFDPAVRRGLSGVIVAACVGGVIGVFVLRDSVGYGGHRGALLGAAAALIAALVSVGASFATAGGSELPLVRAWLVRLSTVLMTIAVTIPVGYLLVNALSD